MTKIGEYEFRLARSKEDRKLVRELRYKVFIEEDGAIPTEEQKALGEEYDPYDEYCDYILILHNKPDAEKPIIAGTYRIINREQAEKMNGFYTETEYDIKKIKKHSGNIAELSRACVHPDYRGGIVIKLLWMALAKYVIKNKISLLFGVASFIGTNPGKYAMGISYLYYKRLAPLRLRAIVNSEEMTRMNLLPKEYIDENLALEQMGPVLKGYLRLGGVFGKGVYVDKPFNTCDVFVLIETRKVNKTYQKFFTGKENAFESIPEKNKGLLPKFFGLLSLPIDMMGAIYEAIKKDEE